MRVRGIIISAAVSAAMIGALLVAGCGSSDEESPANSGGQTSSGANKPLTKVSVGLIASTSYAPVWLAQEKGYFKEEGLEVEIKPLESGAVIIPAVNSGQVHFGATSSDAALLAVTNGVPLKFIHATGNIPRPASLSSRDTTNAVIVGPDSPIRTGKDLEGKTIAIVQLKGLFELGIRATAVHEGIDHTKFKFRTLPIPEGAQAAIDGKVDAAAVVEPFLTTALENGARIAMNIFLVDPKHDAWQAGVWITSDKFLKENPDTVAAFTRAIIKANGYASANIPEVRKLIPTFTQLTPELANSVVLGDWPTELDVDQLQEIADLLVKYGFTEKAPDVAAALAPKG